MAGRIRSHLIRSNLIRSNLICSNLICSNLAAVALLVLAALPAGAAQFLVVVHSAGGAWSFEEAESVQVNGKDKVRSTPLAPPNPATWDSKSIGHLPDSPLNGFALIRRAADGSLLARSGESADWVLLLPDGVKDKASQAITDIWRSASITLKKDRKDKIPTPVKLDELYAILPGADPSLSAARLATESGYHQLPQMDAAQAWRQMLDIIPPTIKSYPSGAAAEKVRDYLRSGMSTRLDKWSDGDAPVTVLEECLLLAKASDAAFPSDARQADLRKQAAATKQWLDRRVAILRALYAGKQSDAFLAAYRDFEPFDKSFSDLSAARHASLTASAFAHMDLARRERMDGDYASAIRNLRLAQLRDPDLAKAGELLEEVRLEIARLSAQKFAELRRGIDPRLPAQVQLQRKLLLAEQYLNDNKLPEAEQALKEAEGMDKDEPKLQLAQARLSIARGDYGMALALLDLYAGTALTPQDFAEGEKLRASVQYKIDNTRTEARGQLKTLYNEQRFAGALQTAATSLKLDNEEPAFLFQAGVNACLLRHCADATPLLHRYLDLTDGTKLNREQRLTALRLLHQATGMEARPASNADTRGRAAQSWFSGAPLDRGVFYDPMSLAFQPKVVRVGASDHLSVLYEWNGNELRSVHTKYEDKKTGSNILKVVAAAASASQGLSLPVSWKTTGRETNDFYFTYYDEAPQISNVSRDNAIVKGRTIPIHIPAFGGFGGIGAIGSLASLSRLGGLGGLKGMAGGMSGLGGMPGLGGAGGLPGFGGAGGLKALTAMSAMGGAGGMGGMMGGMGGGMGGLGGLAGLGTLRQSFTSQNYAIHADPQGGSTSGALTLWSSPRLDPRLTYMVTGKRAAIGFSGNHYFHPFAWDAIHLFELDYDEQGRVRHAWELDEPNAPRLDFTWDGNRLMSVVGKTPAAETVVYSRSLNYAGDKLMSESITQAGKTSHIQYKYNKQGVLTEADCDSDPSLDGRSRKIEFIDETADKGKR